MPHETPVYRLRWMLRFDLVKNKSGGVETVAESLERLRYRGVRLNQYIQNQLPDSANPVVRDLAWQSFQQHCAADGNVLPFLIQHVEPQEPPSGMFRRRGPRKPTGADSFADLPPLQRAKAEEKFKELCEKWKSDLPSWRRAILAGVARRLALHPPDSEWGKRMRRIKGGVNGQRKYRERRWHPLQNVDQAMAKRQNLEVDPLEGGSSGRTTSKILRQTQISKITDLLEQTAGGIEKVVDALRFSREPDAIAFLKNYDSLPETEREHLSIEEICLTTGIGMPRFLQLATSSLMEVTLLFTGITLSTSLPAVVEKNIEMAMTDKGIRDRKLFFKLFFEYFASVDVRLANRTAALQLASNVHPDDPIGSHPRIVTQ